MGATVDELQTRMSSAEFTQWIAFTQREPVGYDQDQWGAYTICATLANLAPRAKNTKLLKPSDFIPLRKRISKLSPRQRAERDELDRTRKKP